MLWAGRKEEGVEESDGSSRGGPEVLEDCPPQAGVVGRNALSAGEAGSGQAESPGRLQGLGSIRGVEKGEQEALPACDAHVYILNVQWAARTGFSPLSSVAAAVAPSEYRVASEAVPECPVTHRLNRAHCCRFSAWVQVPTARGERRKRKSGWQGSVASPWEGTELLVPWEALDGSPTGRLGEGPRRVLLVSPVAAFGGGRLADPAWKERSSWLWGRRQEKAKAVD